ncbi:MAG TPA: ABC transporter ATP-binding protein [Mycobacteriales bacterium]|nr:ABC transporter ATP-binding protein [Mycobacteriales bacterium]
MSDIDLNAAISLRGVGKRYTKYDDAPALITAATHMFRRSRRSKLWAVRDVDLDVQPGESLGVIGRNGAGKSTLLQMLCGVTAPSDGRLRVRGRVAPLIGVGVGFHQELSGRENIYVNATILGLSRREIDKRLDSIIAFAELESFIDTPVKFYSSGMYVRLGFAVAVHTEPDVLLIDEVLAVGDLAFRMKCFDSMRAIRAQGATIVFVTHQLTIIRSLCDRAIVMSNGTSVFDGAPDAAVSHFHDLLRIDQDEESDLGWAIRRSGIATVDLGALEAGDGTTTSSINGFDKLALPVTVHAEQDLVDGFLGVAVHSEDGTLVYADSAHETPWPLVKAGTTKRVTIGLQLALPTGAYSVTVGLYQRSDIAGKQVQLDLAPPRLIHVIGRPMVQGIADLKATFGPKPRAAATRRSQPAARRGSRTP